MGWGNILDGLQDIETTETNMRFKPNFILFFFHVPPFHIHQLLSPMNLSPKCLSYPSSYYH